jgi:hypothetical protein
MDQKNSSSIERAKIKLRSFDDAVERTTELFITWSKWLNGSLFAINGAGLVAVSQTTDQEKQILQQAASRSLAGKY